MSGPARYSVHPITRRISSVRHSTVISFAAIAFVATSIAHAQTPTSDDLKRVLEAQLLKFATAGFTRTVLFEDVRPGTPIGGYFPFQVTATIHDYSAGYPKNRYYGQTCVGRMDKWKFDLRKDDFGGWIAQGRMTVSDAKCKDNPAEGVAAMPLTSIPGTRAPVATASAAGASAAAKNAPAKAAGSSPFHVGEYACYGTGGRPMAGMGFVLKPGGSYQDVDGGRKGTYVHDASASTIAFKGGFLDGQVGRNVRATGFTLSSTVNCEPWR